MRGASAAAAAGTDDPRQIVENEPSPTLSGEVVPGPLSSGLVTRAGVMLRSVTGQTLLTNAINLSSGLVASVMLARWLGPTGRGEIAAVLLWPMLLAYLFSPGLYSAVMYHVTQVHESPERTLGTALVFAAVCSTLAVAVGWVGLPIVLRQHRPEVIQQSRWFLFVIPMTLGAQCVLGVLWAKMRMRALNGLRLVIPVGYMLGILGLYVSGRLGLAGIVVLQLGLNLVTTIGGALALGALRVVGRPAPARSMMRPLLGYGLKVHAGSLSQTANLRLDQALLTAWFPPAQLGIYVVAVAAAGLAQSFTHAVMLASTPRIARQPALPERIVALRSIFRRYWMLAALGTAGLLVVVPFAIPVVFGAAFRGAIAPAMILLAGMFVLGAKDVLASGAQALGNPWLGSRAEIVGVFVTAAALAALLPTLGILGAAIAAVLSAAAQLVIIAGGLSRAYGLRFGTLLAGAAARERGA